VIQTKTELENSACSSCNSLDMDVTDQDIVDYLSLLSAKTGTKIEVISGVSEHGSMISNLGNIGAILRYNPNYTN
jgi:peptide chain release factor subunit 1